MTAYAFVQYGDIASVVTALRDMDGEHIGKNKVKLGFGKSMPTVCVWLAGLAASACVEKVLCRQFSRYGAVAQCIVDAARCRALVYFDSVEQAQQAVSEMRGRTLATNKIQVRPHT